MNLLRFGTTSRLSLFYTRGACLRKRPKITARFRKSYIYSFSHQGGITCGAIDEPTKSSKAIDERVIINFRDKNGVIARFRDKNVVIVRFCDKNVLSIASLFYR